MEIISIGTAMAVLKKIFEHLSDALDEGEIERLLKLIRARFQRMQLLAEMVENREIKQELEDALNSITPERICAAVAMDELGSWCAMIRNDITLALKGARICKEDEE